MEVITSRGEGSIALADPIEGGINPVSHDLMLTLS